MDKADFIIYVVDTSTALDENDEKIIDAIRGEESHHFIEQNLI